MGFLDRLADKAWIGGSYKNLQNVFAHGDEKGLAKYFPYRAGHHGFHFPEALSFCLNRLSRQELQSIFEYYERRRKRSRLLGKKLELPAVIGEKLLPEIFDCLYYFSQRQPRLPIKLYDSVFQSRELMFLNDPQTEGLLHWVLHLSLAILRPASAGKLDLGEELDHIAVATDSKIFEELSKMVGEEVDAPN